MTCAIGRMPPKRSRRLYLWACSEGWIRFGPFAWVGLSEDRDSFLNEKGEAVLVWNPQRRTWKACAPSGFSGDLILPMVTTSPGHPTPKSGSFPILGEEDEELPPRWGS